MLFILHIYHILLENSAIPPLVNHRFLKQYIWECLFYVTGRGVLHSTEVLVTQVTTKLQDFFFTLVIRNTTYHILLLLLPYYNGNPAIFEILFVWDVTYIFVGTQIIHSGCTQGTKSGIQSIQIHKSDLEKLCFTACKIWIHLAALFWSCQSAKSKAQVSVITSNSQFLPSASFNPTKRQVWTWFLEAVQVPWAHLPLGDTTGCFQDGSHSCPGPMGAWQLPMTLWSCPVKWWVTEDLGSCMLQSPCLTVQSFSLFCRRKSHGQGQELHEEPWESALEPCSPTGTPRLQKETSPFLFGRLKNLVQHVCVCSAACSQNLKAMKCFEMYLDKVCSQSQTQHT